MNRRHFLQASVLTGAATLLSAASFGTVTLGVAPLHGEPATDAAASAFSRLKGKLESGQPAVLLIISDSTGHAEDSATRRFARWLATTYPRYTVREHLWAEWQVSKPSGPKEYAAPIELSKGGGANTAGSGSVSSPGSNSSVTLEIYNAALPGGVAQQMIDGSRWSAMIAPLRGAAPDLILWNHGHNHQANLPVAEFPNGRGSFFGPIGRVAFEYHGCPQAAIIQNPWRDNDGYQRVMEWWKAVGEALPALTLVDGYAPFLKQSKNAALYKDSVHPKAEGYELIYQQILAAWSSTPAISTAGATTTCWPGFSDKDPILNADFSTWTSTTEMPPNWTAINGASIQTGTEVRFLQSVSSLSLLASRQNGALQFKFPETALARVRGKTVSIAALCYVPADADQDLQISFMTSSSNQVTGSTQRARDNWKWVVMAGCIVPADCTLAVASIWRSFAKPCNDKPFHIQKLTIVEGGCPKGMLQ